MAGRKITAMHREYGMNNAHSCGECPHYCLHVAATCKGGRSHYKCRVYGESFSEATDWYRNWMACGMYGKPLPDFHVPLMVRLKRTRRHEKPIDGQIGFLEEEK